VKILDKYLLKLFVSTFTTVFVILLFIFILQTVWLFIGELAGKDLDFVSVMKFLSFAMPRVIPLVLPLSVLLASIMTFGSLAENYEFAAMKSSGISLQRSMKFLTVFILFLSIVAFIFANNVIPYAEYKFINFRRNIAQVKPAMAIAEGQFSEVGNYTIKVEKKSGDEGRYLDKVTIHKKSNLGIGNTTIIKAKSGELVSSEKSNVLKLVLKDGNYYEDITPKKYEEREKIPFAKSEFNRYVINIDLSKLNNVKLDEEQITNTNTMLTVGELRYTLDSLSKNYKKDLTSYVDNINARTGISFAKEEPHKVKDTTKEPLDFNKNALLSNFSKSEKEQIIRVTAGNLDANIFSIEGSKYEFENKVKNINMHWIALYDKFVVAFSCILMFFIGAPLGAIIRKGGLGLPIVFAVMIFIVFHFVNTFGKKLAQENGITPFLGCWLSTLLLLPLAIFLTKRATDDKGATIQMDWFSDFIAKIASFFPAKKEKVIAIKTIDGTKIEIEPFAEQTEIKTFTEDKAESKPISVPKVNLSELEALTKKYKFYSTIALVSNIVLIAIVILLGKPENTFAYLYSFVLTLLLFICIIISHFTQTKISSITNKKQDINLLILLFAGFPFYIFFYLYNRNFLKSTITTTENNN
jgi:lipopolysaccharide export system permease protein